MNSITLSFLILSAVYLAAGVYFFVFHWSETALWFRLLLPLLFIVNVVTVYLTTLPKTVKGEDRSSAIALERSFQKVQLEVLCDFLRANRPGKRCLLIHSSTPDLLLLKVLKDSLTVVEEIALPMEMPAEATEPPVGLPQHTSIAPTLQRWIAGAPAFDIAVICTPLPDDCLAPNGTPALFSLQGKELVLVSGYRPSFAKSIENGTILAAVTYKPDATCNEKEFPADRLKAFDSRYQLLSAIPFPTTSKKENTSNAAQTP